MKINITKQRFLDWKPCLDGLRFAKKLNYDWNKMLQKCEVPDWILYIIYRTGGFTPMQKLEISIAYTERALPYYEKMCAGNHVPHRAIAAAKDRLIKSCKYTQREVLLAANEAQDIYEILAISIKSEDDLNAAMAALLAATAARNAYNIFYNKPAVLINIYSSFFPVFEEHKWKCDLLRRVIGTVEVDNEPEEIK